MSEAKSSKKSSSKSSNEGAVVKRKRHVKKKTKKDPNAPKKPLSAYMLFVQQNRPSIVARNPSASFAELG